MNVVDRNFATSAPASGFLVFIHLFNKTFGRKRRSAPESLLASTGESASFYGPPLPVVPLFVRYKIYSYYCRRGGGVLPTTNSDLLAS